MSDNIDDILKLKLAEGSVASAAQVTPTVTSTFEASGFLLFLNFLAVLTAFSAIGLGLLALASDGGGFWYSALICFGSAMSLFISAHVITTIEKCAFYLENLNKMN